MRTDSRITPTVEISNVQSYHARTSYGNRESYAFEGWSKRCWFNSDRSHPLDENFNRMDGQPNNFIGLEIETELFGIAGYRQGAEILKRCVFSLFPADLFKMQHDGSLGVSGRRDPANNAIGIECITQPMTKSFIRNHYKDFRAMYDIVFPALSISCAKSGNCGMHVNLSNALFGNTTEKQVEAIRKLHYFINKNFEFSCRMFKRDISSTGYCGRMDYSNAKTMSIGGGDHYHCLNYTHFDAGRIELRIVGGQENYYFFRNTMECVFFLIDRMKKIRWEDLDDMVKVFSGCNQYVVKRLIDCELPPEVFSAIESSAKHENLELDR